MQDAATFLHSLKSPKQKQTWNSPRTDYDTRRQLAAHVTLDGGYAAHKDGELKGVPG